MKVYTRTGDFGETSLFAGGRISKAHVRLHAYGTIDELNAILGLVVAAGVSLHVQEAVVRVQSELFVVGSDLATPLDSTNPHGERVVPNMVARLEADIDAWQEMLPALRNFILPGGGMAGAFLHQARTVCRRAERWVVQLSATDDVNPELVKYVNRLSDWLFVAARRVNVEAGQPETVWRKSED